MFGGVIFETAGECGDGDILTERSLIISLVSAFTISDDNGGGLEVIGLSSGEEGSISSFTFFFLSLSIDNINN